MPRRGNVPKREILPDPVYGSVLVTRLINSVMLDGKKGVAQKVVYGAFDQIKENDFNLNIPRYVDTFEEEELVDIDEVQQNIANIEAELAQVQAQMKKYLEELGI